LRRSENTTYQTSRTVRRTTTPQGNVRRVSAAVLVDYVLEQEGEGEQQRRTAQPRPPERMEAIRELVAAAIGLDPNRGDQLIVQTLPFEMTLQLQNENLEPPAPAADPVSFGQIIERLQQDPMLLTVAAGAVCLLLGAVAWMMQRSRKRRRVEVRNSRTALPAGSSTQPHNQVGEQAAAQAIPSSSQAAGLPAPAATAAPQLLSARHESLIREVQEIVQKDTELSAGIIHTWLIEEGQQ
jgi:flagellar M-ring protein FliF